MTDRYDAGLNVQARASRFITASAEIPIEGIEDGDRMMSAIASVVRTQEERPLAIYVSVPFCSYKCHFCDWVADVPGVVLRSGAADRTRYVDAPCRQIRHYSRQLTNMSYIPIYTYWGGGTPTRLNSANFRNIHWALTDLFDLSQLEQWSAESTPNDLTAEKLDTLTELSITTIQVRADQRRLARLEAVDLSLAA